MPKLNVLCRSPTREWSAVLEGRVELLELLCGWVRAVLTATPDTLTYFYYTSNAYSWGWANSQNRLQPDDSRLTLICLKVSNSFQVFSILENRESSLHFENGSELI